MNGRDLFLAVLVVLGGLAAARHSFAWVWWGYLAALAAAAVLCLTYVVVLGRGPRPAGRRRAEREPDYVVAEAPGNRNRWYARP